MKAIRVSVVIAVCLLAYFGWAALQPQKASADDVFAGGTFLTTITDAATGAFSSRSVITLHADRSMAAIDSGQGGPAVLFSSQQGTWERESNGRVEARTLDFSFPSAGIARVDYNFNSASADHVSGTITLTVFGLHDNPLDGGGTVVGTFNFTGQRVSAP
jgi:hypothetical protein